MVPQGAGHFSVAQTLRCMHDNCVHCPPVSCTWDGPGGWKQLNLLSPFSFTEPVRVVSGGKVGFVTVPVTVALRGQKPYFSTPGWVRRELVHSCCPVS